MDLQGCRILGSWFECSHLKSILKVFGRCSYELAELVPLSHSYGRSTRYSNRLHDFSVNNPRFYNNVCVHSLFPCSGRPCFFFLPAKCFPLTYNLNGFKCRVDRHLFL